MGDVAGDLYNSLGPWMNEVALDIAVGLMAGRRAQDIEDIIRDSDEGVGWSSVMDLDRTPVMDEYQWLLWLGQFVGSREKPGLNTADQREWIRGTSHWYRGTRTAFEAAARSHLLGPDGTPDTATLIINERVGGNAYQLGVVYLTAELQTTEEALRADLEDQKPAGNILTVVSGDSVTYDAAEIAFDTYADADAATATYDDFDLT